MPVPDDCSLDDLAAALYRRLTSDAPDWTGDNSTDPGVTLVQLFAFLSETLLYRANTLPDRTRAQIVLLAQMALGSSVDQNEPPTASLARPRYFPGQVLTSDDFEAEQLYVRERMRRHNRELHGFGIVRGLGVSIEADGVAQGERVVLGPGFAIAPDGEEIAVPVCATQLLPVESSILFVALEYVERPAHPVQVDSGQLDTVFTRVEESFALALEEKVPAGKLVLARLTHERGHWCVDSKFEALRVASPTFARI
jgi:hypothetical protein